MRREIFLLSIAACGDAIADNLLRVENLKTNGIATLDAKGEFHSENYSDQQGEFHSEDNSDQDRSDQGKSDSYDEIDDNKPNSLVELLDEQAADKKKLANSLRKSKFWPLTGTDKEAPGEVLSENAKAHPEKCLWGMPGSCGLKFNQLYLIGSFRSFASFDNFVSKQPNKKAFCEFETKVCVPPGDKKDGEASGQNEGDANMGNNTGMSFLEIGHIGHTNHSTSGMVGHSLSDNQKISEKFATRFTKGSAESQSVSSVDSASYGSTPHPVKSHIVKVPRTYWEALEPTDEIGKNLEEAAADLAENKTQDLYTDTEDENGNPITDHGISANGVKELPIIEHHLADAKANLHANNFKSELAVEAEEEALRNGTTDTETTQAPKAESNQQQTSALQKKSGHIGVQNNKSSLLPHARAGIQNDEAMAKANRHEHRSFDSAVASHMIDARMQLQKNRGVDEVERNLENAEAAEEGKTTAAEDGTNVVAEGETEEAQARTAAETAAEESDTSTDTATQEANDADDKDTSKSVSFLEKPECNDERLEKCVCHWECDDKRLEKEKPFAEKNQFDEQTKWGKKALQTQDDSIKSQLEQGIRALDFEFCNSYDHILAAPEGQTFDTLCRHGRSYMPLKWTQLGPDMVGESRRSLKKELQEVLKFLKSNPSEIIVLRFPPDPREGHVTINGKRFHYALARDVVRKFLSKVPEFTEAQVFNTGCGPAGASSLASSLIQESENEDYDDDCHSKNIESEDRLVRSSAFEENGEDLKSGQFESSLLEMDDNMTKSRDALDDPLSDAAKAAAPPANPNKAEKFYFKCHDGKACWSTNKQIFVGEMIKKDIRLMIDIGTQPVKSILDEDTSTKSSTILSEAATSLADSSMGDTSGYSHSDMGDFSGYSHSASIVDSSQPASTILDSSLDKGEVTHGQSYMPANRAAAAANSLIQVGRGDSLSQVGYNTDDDSTDDGANIGDVVVSSPTYGTKNYSDSPMTLLADSANSDPFVNADVAAMVATGGEEIAGNLDAATALQQQSDSMKMVTKPKKGKTTPEDSVYPLCKWPGGADFKFTWGFYQRIGGKLTSKGEVLHNQLQRDLEAYAEDDHDRKEEQIKTFAAIAKLSPASLPRIFHNCGSPIYFEQATRKNENLLSVGSTSENLKDILKGTITAMELKIKDLNEAQYKALAKRLLATPCPVKGSKKPKTPSKVKKVKGETPIENANETNWAITGGGVVGVILLLCCCGGALYIKSTKASADAAWERGSWGGWEGDDGKNYTEAEWAAWEGKS